MNYAHLEALCLENGSLCERNIILAPHTTMKVGGKCDIMVSPKTEKALCETINLCKKEGIDFFLLGRGSNVLVSDEGYRGCVILTSKINEISVNGYEITAGAGASLGAVCTAALENGLSGLEFAYGIPGSVGGALYMNAGAYGGEMKDIVVSCTCTDGEKLITLPLSEMALSYRHSAFCENGLCITSVTMNLVRGDKEEIKRRMNELMSRRRDKQPLEYPSCGSTFKRPEGYFAAALIEECGLKGFSAGGAAVSTKHSGFVVNTGGATFEDVMAVVNHVKQTVKEQKGVRLECEMLILGSQRKEK